MRSSSTYKIVLAALFAALICVATMLVQIPIPATGGYANLGDGVILTCAFLMNPVYAVMAAGIGSMLADLLAGYMSYAFGTLIIKAGVAAIGAWIYNRFGRKASAHKAFLVMLFAGILAEVFMVLGYFIYEAVFLGIGTGAVGAIIGNIGQGIVGVIVGSIVSTSLNRSPEVRELMDKSW